LADQEVIEANGLEEIRTVLVKTLQNSPIGATYPVGKTASCRGKRFSKAGAKTISTSHPHIMTVLIASLCQVNIYEKWGQPELE
jgi:hypothetical protein